MKADEVEAFRKMAAQLDALHQEMLTASKKSPDKPVSAFKVKFVNAVLAQADDVLGASRPALGFSQFDEEDLPTASDMSLIITQYVECAEKVRCENISRHYDGVWHWRVAGSTTEIVTSPPRNR